MAHISDHALLRFLERVKGVDIIAARREMQSPALAAAERIGCNTVRLGNGCRLILRNGIVTTVLGPEMLPFNRDGTETRQ